MSKQERDSLGNRMKSYEDLYRVKLPPREGHVIVRVDGKAFHTLTKGLQPYDETIYTAMVSTTMKLCEFTQNCLFGYTQSDEISLYCSTIKDPESVKNTVPELFFGGNINKINSVVASKATLEFNYGIINDSRLSGEALFDCRVFTLPTLEEVRNYFIWRQKDAIRNSVQMLAHDNFSSKQLHGKNATELKEMLKSIGKPWEELPARFQRGVAFKKTDQSILKEANQFEHFCPGSQAFNFFTRKKWVMDEQIPIFTQSREYIPGYETSNVDTDSSVDSVGNAVTG